MLIHARCFIFALGLCLLYSCKKFTDLPQYTITSQVLRLSKSWVSCPMVKNHAAAVDNTRVSLVFQTNGNYIWTTKTTVKGVESSHAYAGTWRFIDNYARIVLEDNTPIVPVRDTFCVETLRSDQLCLLHRAVPGNKATPIRFEPE